MRQNDLLTIPSVSDDFVEYRNQRWASNPSVPKWVNITDVGLDQFFTDPKIAKYCYQSFKKIAQIRNKKSFQFIEPSAGNGAFYNQLPKNKRIGIDIDVKQSEFIHEDFLSWMPVQKENNIVIGNPPFGKRGWLALAFLNHAAIFSDYVAFILPMSFQSKGKGSPMYRVEGLELLHTELLPLDSFVDYSGNPVKIQAIWQIWRKGNNQLSPPSLKSDWVDIYTIDDNPHRMCGSRIKNIADCFLTRTFYNPPSIVKSFEDVAYRGGHGIIIKKYKSRILSALLKIDWEKHSNITTVGCYHIAKHHILDGLKEQGFE